MNKDKKEAVVLLVFIFSNMLTLILFTQTTKKLNISGFHLIGILLLIIIFCAFLIYYMYPVVIGKPILRDLTDKGIIDFIDPYLTDFQSYIKLKTNGRFKYSKEILVASFIGFIFSSVFFLLNTLYATDELYSWECKFEDSKINNRTNKDGRVYTELKVKINCDNGEQFILNVNNFLKYNWNLTSYPNPLLSKKSVLDLSKDDKKTLMENSSTIDLLYREGFFGFKILESTILYY